MIQHYPTDLLKAICINIEKWVNQYVGNEVKDLRKRAGDKVGNEMMTSVAALFAARAICISHMYSGEPIEKVQERLIEAMIFNRKSTMEKLIVATKD